MRDQCGPNANIPLIAFTASAEAVNEGFCEQFGFDAVLAKPVVVRDLLTLVARRTSSAAQEQDK